MSKKYKTKEELVAEAKAGKKKQRNCEVIIWPHHLPYLQSTHENGVLNITNALWLAAFAAYNAENELKLSPEYHGSYIKVYSFIEHKLV